MAASMYYNEDQWALGGITETGTWDTNLEEVWHVVSDGWYAAYPEYFGTSQTDTGEFVSSKLFEAMDVARWSTNTTTTVQNMLPRLYPKLTG